MAVIDGRIAECEPGPNGRVVVDADIDGETTLAFRPGREVYVHLHHPSLLDVVAGEIETNR